MAATEIEFIPDFDQLDEDIQDEDFETTVDVGGQGPGGGAATPSQQQEQESVIAGGVGEALAAAGVFGALLSQLKSITGIASAVLGTISRALIPTVELIADLIRPVLQAINDFVSDPVSTINNAAGFNAVEQGLLQGGLQSQGFGGTAQGIQTGKALGPPGQLLGAAAGLGTDVAEQFIEPPEPDQSDEAKKSQQADNNRDVLDEILGGF